MTFSWTRPSRVLFATAFCLSMASAARSYAAAPQPAIQRFLLPTSLYSPPAIAGDSVAWTTAPGTCHSQHVPSVCIHPIYLHLARISSFQPLTIARMPRGTTNVTLILSLTHLVWMATTYPFAGGWWIWARDLHTGRQSLIDSSGWGSKQAGAATVNLALQGETLVYTANDCLQGCVRPGPSSATIVDLGTHRRQTIPHTHGRCWVLSPPTITAHTVIWTAQLLDNAGCPSSHKVEVTLMSRATGQISRHTITPPAGEIAFDITGNDRYLAWTEQTLHNDQDSRVMLMDVRTARTLNITTFGANRPGMDEHLLVWYARFGAAIGALDLDHWRYSMLAHQQRTETQSTSQSLVGHPFGLQVAWQDTIAPERGHRFVYHLVIAQYGEVKAA